MKSKIYHIVGAVPKFSRKTIETEAKFFSSVIVPIHVYGTIHFVIVCDLFEWKGKSVIFIVCLYLHILFFYQRGRGFAIPLTDLTLPHLCACLKPGPGFPMSGSFLCSIV